MKKISALTALIACASFSGVHARAATNSAIDCLQASARSGSLAVCLNESGDGAAPEVAPIAADPRSPSLSAAGPDAGGKPRSRVVPTPTGYANAEDGSLKAGFYKGLDSGFKTAFAAIIYPAVRGIELSGGPQETNAGTVAFTALGLLLSVPASIVAVVLGAPVGAAAGMIAEKISPGSTDGWFSF